MTLRESCGESAVNMELKTRHELIAEILEVENSPKYRLNQVYEAIYRRGVKSYLGISNLPLVLRQKLVDQLGEVLTLRLVKQTSGRQAQKLLFETRDQSRLETVRMLFQPSQERAESYESVCLSTQSGCALGCRFCATGAIGLKKNLTADEIVDQILYFRQIGEKVDSLSFMGMGEPFMNPNFFSALKIIINPRLMGISSRRLSVSTVGIIPGIERLGKEFPQINLALSLHSPFSAEREKLMPINQQYPLDQVMVALDHYVAKTKNKVFLAYILLAGENDTQKHAQGLVDLIKARGSQSYLYHVNLIRFNAGPTLSSYRETRRDKIELFRQFLAAHNINNTLRQNFGAENQAACGQLYGQYTTTHG